MDLKTALEKVSYGDMIKRPSWPEDHFITFENDEYESDQVVLTFIDIKADDWQIIPAEPKVLDPEEYAATMFSEYMETTGSRLSWFKEIAKKMHQNGRLERDIEYKEIREIIQGLAASEIMVEINGETIFFPEIFKNLKPLNKDD